MSSIHTSSCDRCRAEKPGNADSRIAEVRFDRMLHAGLIAIEETSHGGERGAMN
jgi:hypothetical protein